MGINPDVFTIRPSDLKRALELLVDEIAAGWVAVAMKPLPDLVPGIDGGFEIGWFLLVRLIPAAEGGKHLLVLISIGGGEIYRQEGAEDWVAWAFPVMERVSSFHAECANLLSREVRKAGKRRK